MAQSWQTKSWREVWRVHGKTLVRGVIFSVVVVGIAAFTRSAWRDLQAQEFRWEAVQPAWLLAGLASYSLGMVPFWLYWHLVLQALGQTPRLTESGRAHFVGHLGKYVPGKAMVVVLRTALVRSERTEGPVAAVAVFIETLSMMAVGAAWAAICLLAEQGDHPGLVALALGLLLAAGLPTLPPLFRRLVATLQVRRASPEIESRLLGLTWRVWAAGWLLLSLGWCGYGLSLFCALRALPGALPTWTDFPLLLGSVSLAIVAGFVSLLPAGIGVRELVLLPLLADFGPGRALVAVIIARLTWLVSELSLSAILYGTRRGPPLRDELRTTTVRDSSNSRNSKQSLAADPEDAQASSLSQGPAAAPASIGRLQPTGRSR